MFRHVAFCRGKRCLSHPLLFLLEMSNGVLLELRKYNLSIQRTASQKPKHDTIELLMGVVHRTVAKESGIRPKKTSVSFRSRGA